MLVFTGPPRHLSHEYHCPSLHALKSQTQPMTTVQCPHPVCRNDKDDPRNGALQGPCGAGLGPTLLVASLGLHGEDPGQRSPFVDLPHWGFSQDPRAMGCQPVTASGGRGPSQGSRGLASREILMV